MNWSHLGWGAMIEVAVGFVMLGAAIWLYRRRAPQGTDGYGSQSAVILLIVAAILLIHGFGALEYRPSQGELEAMQGR